MFSLPSQPRCRPRAPARSSPAPGHPKTLVCLSPRAGHEETRHHDAAGHRAVLRGVPAHLDAGKVARPGCDTPNHSVGPPWSPQVGAPAAGAGPGPVWHRGGLGWQGRCWGQQEQEWEHCDSSAKDGVWELPPSPKRACGMPSVLSPGRYRVPKSPPVPASQKLFLMWHAIS